jgi:hypothetical protein
MASPSESKLITTVLTRGTVRTYKRKRFDWITWECQIDRWVIPSDETDEIQQLRTKLKDFRVAYQETLKLEIRACVPIRFLVFDPIPDDPPELVFRLFELYKSLPHTPSLLRATDFLSNDVAQGQAPWDVYTLCGVQGRQGPWITFSSADFWGRSPKEVTCPAQ